MRDVTSLRFRIGVGMTLLIGLAVVIAVAAVRENRQLVTAMTEEIDALQTGTQVSNGVVRSVMNEIRAAQEYLVAPSNQAREEFLLHGDSAYYYQSRYRRLSGLPTSDRLIVNRIANRQAVIEVAFSIAHALADTRQPAEALARAAEAKAPTDSLLAELQALSSARNRSAAERSAALEASVAERQVVLGIGIVMVVVLGVGITRTSTTRALPCPTPSCARPWPSTWPRPSTRSRRSARADRAHKRSGCPRRSAAFAGGHPTRPGPCGPGHAVRATRAVQCNWGDAAGRWCDAFGAMH